MIYPKSLLSTHGMFNKSSKEPRNFCKS